MLIHKKLALQLLRVFPFWTFANFKLSPLSLRHGLKRAKEENNHFISNFHFLNITLT